MQRPGGAIMLAVSEHRRGTSRAGVENGGGGGGGI